MLSPDEAEAAVYSKDGRRLLNLLDKAAKGALREYSRLSGECLRNFPQKSQSTPQQTQTLRILQEKNFPLEIPEWE